MIALKKMPPKLWFFLFSIGVFATTLFRLPGVGAEATQTDIDRYSRNNVNLREAILLYHKDMNTFFDKKLDSLLSKAPDDPDVVPPPEGEECSTSNVSTYCVAMAAVDKYEAFRRALLLTHSPYSVDPSEGDEVVYYDIENVSDAQAERQTLIQNQLELSEKVLDVTLATYQETYLYYNLHTEYWSLIEALEDYRDGLSDVRKEVENYPFKFHNRTTTECT